MPFDGLFVPQPLRDAVSDRAWVAAMVEAERALAAAEEKLGLIPAGTAAAIEAAGPFDADELAEEGRRVGNPAEPLVRRLPEHAHHGATSQDIVDTAAMLVARDALALVEAELDGLARACVVLAERHHDDYAREANRLVQQMFVENARGAEHVVGPLATGQHDVGSP